MEPVLSAGDGFDFALKNFEGFRDNGSFLKASNESSAFGLVAVSVLGISGLGVLGAAYVAAAAAYATVHGGELMEQGPPETPMTTSTHPNSWSSR